MLRGEPLFFGPDERPLFGWLHRTGQPRLPVGLVVCSPFGYEAVCSQRSLRHFAAAAAEAGAPALRFDYDGTGDSAGDDRDPGRLAAWVKSVHHAADFLRQTSGVERVVLLGVRLGALLAAQAAVERDDVAGLVALAPVVAGKAFVRELRALQMALNLREPPPGAPVDKEVSEALGFALSAETKTALSAADLTKLDKAPARSVLLLERADLPPNEAWPAHLIAQKVSLDRRRLPGYVEMMLGAEFAQVPGEMVQATVEWLRQFAAPVPAGSKLGSIAIASRATVANQVVESAELIGEGRRLFGIVSNPASPPRARRGLLLLNAGAVHHIGPNRLYVALARRWAAHGHAVLRLDISGIGDSLPAPGAPENVVYTDTASDDVAAGVEFLRRQAGVSEVHAIGLCSGGYNAFKAAVAGLDLDGVLLINPLTFFFKREQPLESAPHQVAFEAARYRRRALSLDAWMKLLRGEVHFDALARTLVRRAMMMARGPVQRLAGALGVSTGDDLARELSTVAKRDVELRFLFAGGDPGIELLHSQGGLTVGKLERRRKLGIEIIDGPDHTFTPLWSHQALLSALGRHFERPL